VVILAIVIVVLIGVLIVMARRGHTAARTDDLTALQAEADSMRTQLNRERMELGLLPIEGDSESMETVVKRLKKDADTMVVRAGGLQSMLAEKSNELAGKGAELLRSEQLRQSSVSESVRLQGELQRVLANGAGMDQLRRDLTATQSQRDALAADLATARQALATRAQDSSRDELAELKQRFEETQRAKEFFEAKVKELGGELSNTKAKLFALSENDLLPAAVELFRSLRALENQPEAEIATAYSSLGVKLGANVLQTCKFATGTSALAATDEESIRNFVADMPDGDLLLAIGYASETGNVDSNRTLSSDRATAVAELFSSVKRPQQLCQAVYLGQTDRFSSKNPEANQLVEIWRIRKQ
jgi:outer membrane protein OmpA-like peptidoglycan-associated protein